MCTTLKTLSSLLYSFDPTLDLLQLNSQSPSVNPWSLPSWSSVNLNKEHHWWHHQEVSCFFMKLLRTALQLSIQHISNMPSLVCTKVDMFRVLVWNPVIPLTLLISTWLQQQFLDSSAWLNLGIVWHCFDWSHAICY